MKKLILVSIAILSIVSSSAFATSLKPRQVIAGVQNVSEEIRSVTVNNYGELAVQLRDSRVPVRKQLSFVNRSEIFYSAQVLASAEIETKHHQVVCRMALSRYLPMLQVSEADERGDFTGVLRDTLSVHNCAMPTTVGPKEAYAFRTAEILKHTLIVLANEYADENSLE